MTYNLLAQTLIRRTLFPDNGSILKWANRSRPLYQEVKNYNCDIMCFEEMDYTKFNSFWKPKLTELGYGCRFYHSGEKSHGVAIFYKDCLFRLVDSLHIDYDSEKSADIPPRTKTRNVGLILGLSLRGNPDKVVIIGTTHLFWHPFGTYERARQTYIALSKCRELEKRITVLHPEVSKIWKFLAGDFNSQPFDAPYLSITKKPVHYDGRCKVVMACATSYQFSALREGREEEEQEEEEAQEKNQPTDPVPDSFTATEEQLELVEKMRCLHNSLPLRAVSLYSIGYSRVDPENSGIDNDSNEPFFSNWAHSWRGLLDYIFLVRDWDGKENCQDVDNLEDFEEKNEIVLRKLLRMPHESEMGGGQPRDHQFPSDHLCLIGEVGLLLK
ncbi:DEKNAAC105171 [Brettanomyces naardenensis]|uniref:DEKNAAC105171 n=1 Tax=Brettanomyces naardenensis TaxID=13370 RepID=A0A448YSU5_BRENA|nr:DEKNAAC105171 [Brettanomyces naardenensis]